MPHPCDKTNDNDKAKGDFLKDSERFEPPGNELAELEEFSLLLGEEVDDNEDMAHNIHPGKTVDDDSEW